MITTIVADLLLVVTVHVVVKNIVIALLRRVVKSTMVVVNVTGLPLAAFVVLLLTMAIHLLVVVIVAMIHMLPHHLAVAMTSLTLRATTDRQELELLQEHMVEGTMKGHVIGRLSSPYDDSPMGKHTFLQTWLMGLDCLLSPFLYQQPMRTSSKGIG